MRQFETIRVENADNITTVTLNRPDKRNAMNPRLHFEMSEALEELAHDPKTRVLVLTGAGESFCAGQDLREFFYELAEDPVGRDRANSASGRWRMRLLRLFPAPTIAAINGYCFGAGFGVVAACDLAIAAEEAIFGLSEINWGIFPGASLPKMIPDLVPFRDAMYYTLTGEQFDGRKASEMRFVNAAVPRAELSAAVLKLANTLKEKDPAALKAAKEVFKLGRDMDYEQMAAWTDAKSAELRLSTRQRWKAGVEQFKSGKYRPGFESYEWRDAEKERKP